MSNQLITYLNSIYSKMDTLKHIPNKKKLKKHNYTLKDGIIQMSVRFNNAGVYCIMCENPKNCDLKKCYHVYYILINILKLNIDQLTLLWRDNNWKNFIIDINKANNDYTKEECGICLENIENNQQIIFSKLFQCLDCGCFSHIKCLSQAKDKHCLFCYTSFENKLN